MTIENITQAYIEHQQQYASALAQQPDWLRSIRNNGIADFAKLGFPSLRNEAWKYTSTKAMTKKTFLPSATSNRCEFEKFKSYLFIAEAHHLVFIDNQICTELSSELDENIIVTELSQAMLEHADLLEAHFAKHTEVEHGFTALNNAYLNKGTFIHIPKNTQVAKPIHLVFIASADDIANYTRNVLILDQGSQAKVIEHYIGLNEAAYLNNVITDIQLNNNANLTHYKILEESDKAFHIATSNVAVERDAVFNSHSFAFHGRIVRSDINVKLKQENAGCDLKGLYLATAREHVDHHTKIDHLKPYGQSNEFYKGILDENARAVFNGRVFVHEGAIKTNANQANKNLLLSNKAEVDTKPQLEIYNDDVKCAHGATVGQLDKQALFYLTSRGIDAKSAKDLLTYAFANEMIEMITEKEIHDYLRFALLKKLSATEKLQELV